MNTVALTSLKINSKITITRDFFIPERFTLGDLHVMLQAGYGWFSYHDHGFKIGRKNYEVKGNYRDPNGVSDANETLVASLLKDGRDTKVKYQYDSGDGWQVGIVLSTVPESLLVKAQHSFAPDALPPSCFAGTHGDPVDDCGGTSGYEDMAANPKGFRWWLKSQGQPNWSPKVCEIDRINGFISDFFTAIEPGSAGGIFSPGSPELCAWQKAHFRAYPSIDRAKAA